MTRTTITEYRAANGGDYDRYTLSNGEVYWLWFKSPFRGSEAALVHVMSNDPTKEIGTVYMERTNYGTINIHLETDGKIIHRAEVKITIRQEIRPNKKYYFDKIVRNFLM